MLEHRIRQLERTLRAATSPAPAVKHYLDIPKETVIAAFGVLRDAGGYHYMLAPEDLKSISQEEIDAINKLTPEELYDTLVGDLESRPTAGETMSGGREPARAIDQAP